MIVRCKHRKTPGDGGMVDGCGWQGERPDDGICPSCGVTGLLRDAGQSVARDVASYQAGWSAAMARFGILTEEESEVFHAMLAEEPKVIPELARLLRERRAERQAAAGQPVQGVAGSGGGALVVRFAGVKLGAPRVIDTQAICDAVALDIERSLDAEEERYFRESRKVDVAREEGCPMDETRGAPYCGCNEFGVCGNCSTGESKS